MVAQELDVVLDIEPFVFVAREIDAIRHLDFRSDRIGRGNGNFIRNQIMHYPKVNRLKELISRLGLPCRETHRSQ